MFIVKTKSPSKKLIVRLKLSNDCDNLVTREELEAFVHALKTLKSAGSQGSVRVCMTDSHVDTLHIYIGDPANENRPRRFFRRA